jgi:hypothetical protein
MVGRVKRKALAAIPTPEPPPNVCALCDRPLGLRVEWHHPVPKSEGGRETVPLHPICHRTIHAVFENGQLARDYGDLGVLRAEPAIRRFLAWIAGKPPDFSAPTRSARRM